MVDLEDLKRKEEYFIEEIRLGKKDRLMNLGGLYFLVRKIEEETILGLDNTKNLRCILKRDELEKEKALRAGLLRRLYCLYNYFPHLLI